MKPTDEQRRRVIAKINADGTPTPIEQAAKLWLDESLTFGVNPPLVGQVLAALKKVPGIHQIGNPSTIPSHE